MAIRPEEALAISPKAQLSPADLADLANAEAQIDGFLAANWTGTSCTVPFPPARPQLLAEFVRRYQLAGWEVRVVPVKSTLALAENSGPPSGFEITLLPCWERFTRIEVDTEAFHALVKTASDLEEFLSDADETSVLDEGAALRVPVEGLLARLNPLREVLEPLRPEDPRKASEPTREPHLSLVEAAQ